MIRKTRVLHHIFHIMSKHISINILSVVHTLYNIYIYIYVFLIVLLSLQIVYLQVIHSITMYQHGKGFVGLYKISSYFVITFRNKLIITMKLPYPYFPSVHIKGTSYTLTTVL